MHLEFSASKEAIELLDFLLQIQRKSRNWRLPLSSPLLTQFSELMRDQHQ